MSLSSQNITRFDRQEGLLYQNRVENTRVYITGAGPIIGDFVTHLALLGFGEPHGYIAVNKRRKVLTDDVLGQFLLRSTDVGKPLSMALKEAVWREFSIRPNIIGIDDAGHHKFDAVVAAMSSHCKETTEIDPPTSAKPIWAISTKTAAYIGMRRPKFAKSEFNILTPSLAAVAAGFAAVEVLRQNSLIRPSDILSQEIILRYIVQHPNILKKYREAARRYEGVPIRVRVKIAGEKLSGEIEEYKETVQTYCEGKIVEQTTVDDNRVILKFTISKDSNLARLFFDHIDLYEEAPEEMGTPKDSLMFSPLQGTQLLEENEEVIIIDKETKVPSSLHDKKIFFLGIGGIGSWSSVLFSVSNTKNCTMILNDHDQKVESHNLNRQILFSMRDLNYPKVVAAQRRLRELNPTNQIVPLPWQTEIGVANAIVMKDLIPLEEYERKKKDTPNIQVDNIELPREILREESVIANALTQTDILVCGPDSIRTRYIASLIGKLLKIPVVSAGAERMEGKVDYFAPHGDCYVCRYGEDSKEQYDVVSCTGRLPTPSTSVTSGIIGSMQMAITLAAVSGLKDITHFLQYYLRYQTLAQCIEGISCHHTKKKTCPEHLNLPKHENPIIFFGTEKRSEEQC